MILLNMERLDELFDLGVIVELVSDMEMNPESTKEGDDISFFVLVGNPKGLKEFEHVEDLADTVGTGLTPRIDFNAVVDSSKLVETFENMGFSGVDVEWIVDGATLAFTILGMSSTVVFLLIFVQL